MKILSGKILLVLILSPVLAIAQNPEVSIHVAALTGNIPVLQQYIDAGADLNKKDAYGSTPLIIAATFGQTEAARMLIEADANLEITNNQGSSPLQIAALFGRIEIVQILLNHGANRYYRNMEGSTAYDIVAAPLTDDMPLYEQLTAALGPLGLKLDYEQIKTARPKIADMLRPKPGELKSVTYEPLPFEDWKVSTPKEQGLDPMLLAELYNDAGHLETIYSLLVIKNGQLVAEKYFNEGAVDQKARLQSVTKSFTSALVGIALEQGCLESEDQKMMEFFPELVNQISDPRKEQITIRHLLQMRAGYPWEESTQELFDILYKGFRPSTLVEVALTQDPDTEFQYSNLSSHILGIIVARACETNLKSYATENLFTPLGIEAVEWNVHWEDYYGGAAGLYLRARDVAKFGLMYLNQGEFEEKQIIPASWVQKSLQHYSQDVNTAGIRNGSVGRYLRHIGYGYQWWFANVDDYPFNLAWGHGGQFIFLLDDYNMVVVVTSDPQHGKHDDQAWKQERANINLVGKFIQSLIRSNPLK